MSVVAGTARGAGGERSGNLDALRALAALYVLAGHAYLLSGSVISFHDRHPLRLAINTGGAGVWLFFALSGYLIAAPFVAALHTGAPLPDLRSYARRRALRIYPAYWVAFAAVLLVGLPAGTGVTLRQVLVHGALLHNLVPGWQQAVYFASWTLTLEVLFYAAVAVGAWALRRLRPQPFSARDLTAGVLALWASSVAFVAVAPQVTDGRDELWLRILFPSMVSMFCPGLLVAVATAAGRDGWRPGWYRWIVTHRRASTGLALSLAVAGAYGATARSLLVYDASRQLFAVASGVVIVLATTRPPIRRGGALLSWLGEISYGIYLWQGAVIYVLLRHESWIPLRRTGAIPYVVHLAVLLALTLPLAWASWRLVEKPAIALSKRSRPVDSAAPARR